MKEIILIAWRNLWRNKRRTFITISSIFFAVFFAILMRSFQLGVYDNMINNLVTQFTGHLQIQDKEYFDNPQIDYSIPYSDSIIEVLENIPEISFFVPRIQTGCLASSGDISKVAIIMGVDYEKENNLSNIDKRIIKFYLDSVSVNKLVQKIPEKHKKNFLNYKEKVYTNRNDLAEDLASDGIDTSSYIDAICEMTQISAQKLNKFDNDVLIGYKLAQFLELKVGDSLIMIGQGYHGASAVGKFKIVGLLSFPTDAFNDRFIYMPLYSTQMFLSAYQIDRETDTVFYVNYIAVNTKYEASLDDNEYEKILKIKSNIEKQINNKWITVIGWRNLNKDMIQGLQMDNASGKIMLFVLYLIITFGVLGTVMMMIAERKREFGVMMAIGMKRNRLSVIVAIEMFFMGIIAAILGIIITAPIIWIGHIHPITLHGEKADAFAQFNMEPVLPFAWFDTYILSQMVVVVVIVLIVLIYAIFKIKKMKVIDALKT